MKRYLLMSILSIIAITGCGPDKLSDTDNQEVVWKVSRLVFEDYDYYGFKYDLQGRMNQITWGMATGGDEETMAWVYYEGKQVTKLLEDGVNVSYDLDAEGRVVSASPTFRGDGGKDDYEVFEYDVNGYISKVTSPLMPDFEFEVVNGNYTRMSVGSEGLSIEYTDYPNNYSIDMNFYMLASSTWTPFYCLWFSKFPGTACQNLIKRISGSDNVVTYYYSFDAAGRVSSITMNKSYGDGENIIAGMTVQYEE